MNATLQVQLTNECNVKCPYCYIKQDSCRLTLEVFKMQYEYLDALFDKMNHADYPVSKRMNVGYFGGEPLLNMEEMIKINDFLKSTGKMASSHVQTNGTLLTREMQKLLREHNIAWSYSFDGIWQKNIPFRKKQDMTYFECLDRKIRDGELGMSTPKVMISPASVFSLNENYEYFLSLGIRTPDFTLVRDDVWSDEDIMTYDKNLSELTEYLVRKTVETKEIHCIGIFSLYLADTICGMSWKRPFSCFSGINGCAVTPAGVIYPCSRFYSNAKMPLVDCNTGHFYDENIAVFYNTSDTRTWEKCKKCSLYRFCNAGCNYSQMRQNDFKYLTPVDSVCRMMKISYKHAYVYYQECKRNHIDIESFIRRMFEQE